MKDASHDNVSTRCSLAKMSGKRTRISSRGASGFVKKNDSKTSIEDHDKLNKDAENVVCQSKTLSRRSILEIDRGRVSVCLTIVCSFLVVRAQPLASG